MHLLTKTFAIAISSLCLSSAILADSWQIMQEVDASNVGSDTTLRQTNSTDNSSVQTLNSINLDTTDSVINTGSNQMVKLGTNTLSLIQDAGTSKSQQAVNRASAKNVTDLTQVLEASSGDIQLRQNGAAGNGNSQAINAVNASNITRLRQKIVAPNASLKASQDKVEKNVQAANLITVGRSLSQNGVEQNISVKEAVFSQMSTTQTLQAGNALLMGDGSTVTGGAVTQKFTVNGGEFSLRQDQAGGSHQSANYAGIDPSK